MADMRDRLIELLAKYFDIGDSYAYNLTRVKEAFGVGTVTIDDFVEFDDDTIADIADHLLANGVQMSKSSCPYCCANGEGHGRLASSYDDEDGMRMSIHPSAKRANGYQSQAWWATVHFRGECRDFYIEVCPFCGRRLVPLKEEYETCCP